MKYIDDCAECQRLWHAYSAATIKHIKLESKLQIAALAREAHKIVALTLAAEDAGRERAVAREAIATHENTAHADAAGSAASGQ